MSKYAFQARQYKENTDNLFAVLDKVEENIYLLNSYMQENPKALVVDVSPKLEEIINEINMLRDNTSNIVDSLVKKAKQLDDEIANKNSSSNNSNNNNSTSIKSVIEKAASSKINKSVFNRIDSIN